jgi:AraC-like DNA-binding protein
MNPSCKYATFRAVEAPSELVPLGARSVGQHTVPAHWRDHSFKVGHSVFFWGLRGVGIMELDGQSLRIEPQCIGVLLPGDIQSIQAGDHEWEYCWWTLDGAVSEAMVAGFGFKSGLYQAGPAPLHLIKELDSVIQRPGRRNELQASAIAYELLSQSARYSRPKAERQIQDPLVNDAVDVILRSWHDCDFGVDSLADSLGTHRSTLSRRFSSATGCTLIEYINSMRMHNAAHLLRHSELNIAEIASQCGYRDANYFSKQFSTRFGIAPSDVRKGERGS